MSKPLFFFFVVIAAASSSFAGDVSKKLRDVAASPDLQEVSASVGMMVSTKALKGSLGGRHKLEWEDMNFCEGEGFPDGKKLKGAHCTVFVVGYNRVMTAAHCLEGVDCKDFSFAFGIDQTYDSVSSNDVYRCKSVDQRGANTVGAGYTYRSDFAVIELDRPLKGREPLTLAKSSPSGKTIAIGHANGGRLKAADGRVNKITFDGATTSSTIVAGMSGGPILNEQGEVTGIISSGIGAYPVQGKKCNAMTELIPEFEGMGARYKSANLFAESGFLPANQLPDLAYPRGPQRPSKGDRLPVAPSGQQ